MHAIKYVNEKENYFEGWLEVDHIDGDPSNHDPENLQTLCSCCHKWKTLIEKDYKSPGKKALNLTSNGSFRTSDD